jgi:hypothetical protein
MVKLIWMIFFRLFFLMFSVPAVLAAQSLDFSNNAWKTNPSKLTFKVTTAGSSQINTFPLPIDKIRGYDLDISVSVKATAVSTKPQSWNGIKVMLKIDDGGQTSWPQLGIPDGTFDWRLFTRTISVPKTASAVSLLLGLENVTGTVEFRDLSIKLNAPSVQAGLSVFTGHETSLLRGAMVRPLTLTPDGLKTLIKDWGANVIRWQLNRPTGGGPDTASYDVWLEGELKRLDQGLVLAKDLGCLVVVDLHSPPGGGNNLGGYVDATAPFFKSIESQKHFIKVWEKIALRYKGNRTIWGFDLLNEPVDDETAPGCKKWNALALDAGRAVRAIDTDRTLIVECANWASPYGFAAFQPIPLDRVVYSCHMYLPFEYTYQGEMGQNKAYAYPGMVGSSMCDRAALVKILAPAYEFSKQWKVQMYVGEFSAIRWAEGADRYIADLISIFEEYRWDWTFHAFREWHGWDPEYDVNRYSTAPATADSARLLVLKKAFKLNASGK